MRHMLYGSFGVQNTMVAFVFRFDPREGEYKIEIGQKGQIFKIKKKLKKNMDILSSFVSEFQKCYYFLRTAIRNAKNSFQKVTSSPLPIVLPLHSQI